MNIIKIIVLGDIYVDPDVMEEHARNLKLQGKKRFFKYNWEGTSIEKFRIRTLNIEKNGPEAEGYPKEVEDEIEDADIILTHVCPIPERLLKMTKNLKIIGTCRGGVEHIDVNEATKMNVPVIHCIRNAEPVADFTLGLMYAETRNIARGHCGIKAGKWLKDFDNSHYTATLKEHKVGLIGLGYIGKMVADKLSKLGVEVWGYDPYVTQEELDKKGIKLMKKSIKEIFSMCDIVSLHLRLSEDTESFIDRKYLGLMKKDSYLINTSRAGIVKKEDLYEILKNKKIAGAALDVYWEEPINPEDEYFELDNITFTPHLAGNTVDAIYNSPKLLIKEMNDFLVNKSYDMVVNFKEDDKNVDERRATADS